jgi:hypothetical protein
VASALQKENLQKRGFCTPKRKFAEAWLLHSKKKICRSVASALKKGAAKRAALFHIHQARN